MTSWGPLDIDTWKDPLATCAHVHTYANAHMLCCLLHHLPDKILCPNIFIQLQMLINLEATSKNAVIHTGHMDHALTIRINSTHVNTAAYTADTCCNNTTVSMYV